MKKLCTTAFILMVVLILAIAEGCTYVFFDQPQPVDSKNLKVIPENLRGIWVLVKSKQDPALPDTIMIDETSYHNIEYEYYRYSKAGFDSQGEFKIIDDRIFPEEEDDLGYPYKKITGFPYKLLNDTICFNTRKEMVIALSDTSILRKAKDCYVMSLKRNNWWEIFIIEKSPDGIISINYPDMSVVKDMGLEERCYVNDTIQTGEHKSDSVYYHAELSSKEIAHLIHPEYEGAIYILKPDSTFESIFTDK